MPEMGKVLPEEFDEMMKLHFYAFQYKLSGEDYERRRMLYKKQNILGFYDNGKLVSKIQIRPFCVSLGHLRVKMGGILGVATYPEYRRRGLVRELLIRSLEEMKERGQIVSFLHAFSYDFYRKYGWEKLSGYLIVKLNRSDLKMRTSGEEGYIKRYDRTDFNRDLNEIYEQYSTGFGGMLVRDEDWWEHQVISKSTAAVYYDFDGRPKGYMIYRLEASHMNITEFTALTPDARSALFNYICQHDSMVNRVTMEIPADDPLLFQHINPKAEISWVNFGMARVVDAEALLEIYPFKKEKLKGALKLSINDDHAPWNNRDFLIGAGPADKGLEIDVGSFSAMVFNVVSPKDLYGMGLIKGDYDTVSELQEIMPDFKPCTRDYF